jgi:hypothetical protein
MYTKYNAVRYTANIDDDRECELEKKHNEINQKTSCNATVFFVFYTSENQLQCNWAPVSESAVAA